MGAPTAGEDGALKMWSRSGMLRSTLVQANTSIYATDWGPSMAEVAYSHRKNIVVKPLAPNSKPNSVRRKTISSGGLVVAEHAFLHNTG